MFDVTKSALSDGSFDVTCVAFLDANGAIWATPDQPTALRCATSLNAVFSAFAKCQSTVDAQILAAEIRAICK